MRVFLLLALLQAAAGLSLSHKAPLAINRRLRGGAVDDEAASAVANAAAADLEEDLSEVDVDEAMDAFSATLDSFMKAFQELEQRVSSTARKSFLGQEASPEEVAQRPDRVAFKEALELLSSIHGFIIGRIFPCQCLTSCLASRTHTHHTHRNTALLRGPQGDGEASIRRFIDAAFAPGDAAPRRRRRRCLEGGRAREGARAARRPTR